MLKIQIILGSTREGRVGEKVAKWVMNHVPKLEDVKFELVDLKDYPLPFYHDAGHPKMVEGKYSDQVANDWVKKIHEADGFIIVTPEYNHGYPAVLKNALDYVYSGWNNKPVGFVSYGGFVGGARSVQQLRQVVIELQMAPIREAVHIIFVNKAFNEKGEVNDPMYNGSLVKVFDSLLWWAKTLKEAREKSL